MSRRWTLGLALSVCVHALAVGALVGWSWLRGAAPSRIEIDVTGMRLEDLKELPLGAPGSPAPAPKPRPRPRPRAPDTTQKAGTLVTREAPAKPQPGVSDAVADEAGGPGPTDLGQLGPEGSRFTLLLRLDRVKGTPYAGPLDAVLVHMPDRRDLLEGTGLSLYDDFEALLVATPNPLDYRVTFLAARHHLADGPMRAAVDRGARATGRVVAWRNEGGRPWGERRARAGVAPPAARDERLIVMPTPGLVVVTPPAYRTLPMVPARKPGLPAASGPDAGTVANVGGADPDAPPSPSWSSLLRRIDSESGLLPPNAVAMASAVDLFRRSANGPVVFLGVELDVPRAITAVLGVEPEPFLELTATFADEAAARHWEETWPGLQRKLRTNPYVVLGGMSSLVSRLTSAREGASVKLRLTATQDETVRLLQVAASALP
jgi:hypothetical protein